MNFWLLSPQSSITFFIRTMEGICTLQNHAKFCKITWEFAKWKMQERRGRWKQPTARRGVRPRVNVLLLITTGVFLFTINWTYPPHEVDLSSSSLDFFSSCNRSVLIIKWIVLLINWISPRHQMHFSSLSIGFFLLISWISTHPQLDFYQSYFFLLIKWVSPCHQMDFSSSSIGFLLLKKWIAPHYQMNFSSSSTGFLLLVKWISHHPQIDFSSSSIGFLLLIK